MKKCFFFGLVLLMCVFAGCAKEEQIIEENKLNFRVSEMIEFENVPQNAFCSFLDGNLFCLCIEFMDDENWNYVLMSGNAVEKMAEYRSEGLSNIHVKCFDVFKENGENKLIILAQENDRYFFRFIDLCDFSVEETTTLDDAVSGENISKLYKTEEGFALMGNKNVYLVDKKGKVKETYIPRESTASMFCSDNGFGLFDNRFIYEFDISSGEKTKVCDLENNKIRGSEILDASFDNDKIILLTRDNIYNRIYILSEIETAKNSEEKTELIIYEPYFGLTQVFLDEFNFQSDKYHAVFSDSKKEPDVYFAGTEAADVLVLDGFDAVLLEDCQKKGYVKNLYPFMQKSELIKKEDLNEAIFRCFEDDGKLFGLAESISFSSNMWEKDRALEKLTPHTLVEYYGNLSREKGVPNALSYEDYLYKCLPGFIHELQSGDSEKFFRELENVLEAIKEEQDKTGEKVDYKMLPEWERELLFDETYSSAMYVSNYEDGYGLIGIGYPDIDGNAVYAGMFDYIMAIPENSENPEGAFEFISFMMTKSKIFGNLSGKYLCLNSLASQGAFPGTVPGSAEGTGMATLINGQVFECTVSGKEINALDEMAKKAVFETPITNDAKEIIFEESVPYFLGEKTLESVMDIIKSRIGIMLDEKR